MIKRIWGVTFNVSDLEKAAAFYEKTLGLNKKYEYSSYVGLDCGGIEIGLRPREGMKPSEHMPSVEFLVDDVDDVCQTLRNKGVKFTREPHDEPWGGREASFRDPDGNVLEIMQIDWEKYFNVATKGSKKT